MQRQEDSIKKFYNKEFGSMEVLLINGQPYFPASECARVLGYKNPRDAVARHCKADGVVKHDGVSFTQNQYEKRTRQTVEKTYINEGNLYRLIIRSKLPAAVNFEAWIMNIVIPSIRKYGAYIFPDKLEEMVSNPEFAAALLEELQKERNKNAELAPKAGYCDRILLCGNVIPVSLIAKEYGMSAAAFNELLHDLHIQYRISGTWLLYQEYAGRGYTQTRTYQFTGDTAKLHTCWTQRGRMFLYERLADRGIIPIAEFLDDLEAALENAGFVNVKTEQLHMPF